MKRLLAITALALAVVLLTVPSFAATEAWNFTANNGLNWTNGNWTFGTIFVPTRNIEVYYLGYYAQNGVGNFTSNHPVGMFDAAGNLLSSTVITNASTITDFNQPFLNVNPPTGNFVYNPVTPFTLIAGQTYVLEGVSGTDPYTWNDTGFTVYLPLTITGDNWVLGAGLTFNGTGNFADVADGWWGPNFATPEPGTFLMLGSGILGLAGMLRRKLF